MEIFKKKNTVDLGWTHEEVQISDIRLLHKLYALNIHINTIGEISVFVNKDILEDRLNGYFLGKPYTREDVLNLKWNMYLTKGYFIKIDSSGKAEKFDKEDKSRFFVSFLEVAGPLGTFDSVYKNNTKD